MRACDIVENSYKASDTTTSQQYAFDRGRELFLFLDFLVWGVVLREKKGVQALLWCCSMRAAASRRCSDD